MLGRRLGDLAASSLDQIGSEGTEPRHLALAAPAVPALLLLPGRRHPDPPPHVDQDVLQFLFGRALVPAFALGAEGDVAALAVGREAQREAAPALPLAHLDFAFGPTGHRPPPGPPAAGRQGQRESPAGLASRLRRLARRRVGGRYRAAPAVFLLARRR
jgi:hypothetical protein